MGKRRRLDIDQLNAGGATIAADHIAGNADLRSIGDADGRAGMGGSDAVGVTGRVTAQTKNVGAHSNAHAATTTDVDARAVCCRNDIAGSVTDGHIRAIRHRNTGGDTPGNTSSVGVETDKIAVERDITGVRDLEIVSGVCGYGRRGHRDIGGSVDRHAAIVGSQNTAGQRTDKGVGNSDATYSRPYPDTRPTIPADTQGSRTATNCRGTGTLSEIDAALCVWSRIDTAPTQANNDVAINRGVGRCRTTVGVDSNADPAIAADHQGLGLVCTTDTGGLSTIFNPHAVAVVAETGFGF